MKSDERLQIHGPFMTTALPIVSAECTPRSTTSSAHGLAALACAGIVAVLCAAIVAFLPATAAAQSRVGASQHLGLEPVPPSTIPHDPPRPLNPAFPAEEARPPLPPLPPQPARPPEPIEPSPSKTDTR